MHTTLSKEAITQEILSIVKANTVSSLPVQQLEIRSHHSTNFLHFKFVDDFSYMVSNDTIFFSTEDNGREDDLFIIDCYYKQGFLDFEKYFNITGEESLLEFFSRVYDEVYEVYRFVHGEDHIKKLSILETFQKRPTTVEDVLFYAQYDGDNYCFLLDVLGSASEDHFEIRLYPVVNLQKRTIEIVYYIVSCSKQYDDYQASIDELWYNLVLSKLNKSRKDLTEEDSTVLQMLNI